MNDDFELDAELGFEPAVSVTGGEPRAPKPVRTRRLRLRVPRRVSAGIVLFGALAVMGTVYGTITTTGAGATADPTAAGRQIYQVSCITCHGANLQGVAGRGPSLIGVGAASVYFQVSTGRMPAVGQGPIEPRKTAKYTDAETRSIAAFVQSMGGGPNLPNGALQDNATMAEGGELFRVNCAACHGTTFKGGALSAGKQAPSLIPSSDLQIWTAMLSGPESMPVFSNNTITPAEKAAIVAYIQNVKESKDPGGHGIGRIGPVSEAIVCWVAGVGALMVAILWIGAKTQ